MRKAGPERGERIQFGPPPLGGLLDGSIWYVLAIPGDDDDLTLLQGFSKGITEVSSFLRSLAWLPSSVWEFGFSWDQKIELMQQGLLSYQVIPINVAHLGSLDLGWHSPFCVVFSSAATDEAVAQWVGSCTAKPLHATTAPAGGEIIDGGLGEKELRSFVRARLERLSGLQEFAAMAVAMLESMAVAPARSALSFHSNSHNSCVPNELLLYRVGHEFPGDTRLNPSHGNAPVIEAIVRETQRIRGLRQPQGTTPSIILATPGRSRLMEKGLLERIRKAPKKTAKTLVAAVRNLKNQTGYFTMADYELLKLPEFQTLLQLRALEHHAFTDALAVRAMSELSAFVRIPPAVDAVWGTLRKVADCYRGDSDRRTSKLSRVMKQFRAELRAAVPEQLLPLLDQPPTDIRIVSDLPMEWTPTQNGESLLFRHVCSRIPSTPGNMLFQTALPKPRIHLSAGRLSKILVVRSLDDDDPIRDLVAKALRVLKARDGIDVSLVDVKSQQAFVDALNGFDGGCVVFDGHGAKTASASGLYIGGELIEQSALRGVARLPPIAFPLACDTQPIDTQHSSAALAFLGAGARTVVGSLLPIDARTSSIFLSRLVRAIHVFLPTLFKDGISRVTWAELFSVIQQSQLIHETGMKLFEPRWGLDRDAVTEAMGRASVRVFLRQANWYEHFLGEFAALLQMTAPQFQLWMQAEMPLPDCELFVQLGDPESVVIHLADPPEELDQLHDLGAGPPDGAATS